MEQSAEKIHKPKKHPAGKTKIGGLRVRIEWEDSPELVWPSGDRMPKTHVSLKGSQGRRTGVAKSLNPYCGRSYPITIPSKRTGKAIVDPKGDFIISGEIEKPKHYRPNYPIMTWEGEKLPINIKKL